MQAKSFCSLVVAVLLGCACPAPASIQQGADGKATIKIGVLYNLTGAQASLDIPSANGAKLAAKQVNDAGGIDGKMIELLLYDGTGDPATISRLTDRLVVSDRVVAMMGFSDTDMVMAAAPIAAQAGIPFVTSGATSPKLPEKASPNLYLACFGDNIQAAAAAEYAFNTLNAKTAYLMTDQDMEYTVLLSGYFTTRFRDLGGRIILDDKFHTGDKEFSAQINRLKGANSLPDLLFISSGPEEIGHIVQQFRKSGITRPILGGDAYDSPNLVGIAGKNSENVYFTAHALMNEANGTARVKKFIADYRQEYHTVPEDSFAGLGYDTVMLIVNAIRGAGSTDPKAITAALSATTNLQGVTGSISFSAGRIPMKNVAIIQIIDGKYTLVAEEMPISAPAP